jgi:hypothetical protein
MTIPIAIVEMNAKKTITQNKNLFIINLFNAARKYFWYYLLIVYQLIG